MHGRAGTDAMAFKSIFAKKLAFFTKNKAKIMHKFSLNIGF
jgi:hypothetical protein